jgi:RNase H-like domain found in reverse transcriptase
VHEKNYKIIEKELLAIIVGLKAWQHWIQGSAFTLRVITDHHNLLNLQSFDIRNSRHHRWMAFLASFKLTIEFQAGVRNGQADFLSRPPQTSATSNKSVKKLFKVAATRMVSFSPAVLAKLAIAHDSAEGGH